MILCVFGDETYFECSVALCVTFRAIQFLSPIECMTGQNVTDKLTMNTMSFCERITANRRRMATMILVLPPHSPTRHGS